MGCFGSRRTSRVVAGVVLSVAACGARAAMVTWDVKQDPSQPGARFWHAATYDAARRLTIVFGGLDGKTARGDTWGWDGTAWTLIAPERPDDPDTPTPRYAAAMSAFTKPDGSGGLVLFGGLDANDVPLGDTFELVGREWHKLATTPSPSGRYAAAMAYDAALAKVVLFGGADRSATGLAPSETWGWDGATWSLLASGSPPPRAAHALAYDAARSTLVLFGGFDGPLSVRGDTWQLDATGWHEACAPTPCPIPPRFLHAMAYDGAQQRTILFGGSDSSGRASGDAYAFDGTAWDGMAPGGDGVRRTGHVVAFDASRNRAVLFGGRDRVDLADTREAVFTGQPCRGPDACATGLCVDGVCCRTACGGACRRCDRDNPLFLAQFGAHVKDGVCRVPVGADPDGDCAARGRCGGVCAADGRCRWAGAGQRCGLCAVCNSVTGACDQLPAGGDDDACPPARCDLASNACRTFVARSTGVARCVAVGRCGWRWSDCTEFEDHDGASCTIGGTGAANSPRTGTCARGVCGR